MNSAAFEAAIEKERRNKGFVALSLAEPRERPATEEELRAFEVLHRCVLPTSYRYFARHYGCGHFVFAVVLSTLPESAFYIGRTTQALRSDFLPVSSNGCGDFYGFPCEAGICIDSILFADHERSYATQHTDHEDFFSFLVANGLNGHELDA